MKRSAHRQQLELFDLSRDQRPLIEPPRVSPPPPLSAPIASAPEPEVEVEIESEPESTPPPNGPDLVLTLRARRMLADLNLPAVAAKVSVIWNSRLRTTAGRAYCKTQLIELNPALADVSEEEIERTFLHELAHLVAYARAKNRRIEPHGAEWRQACADLGIAGEDRCHDLPFVRTRQRRNFAYVCPNCQRELRRVRKIRKSAACFHCCQTFNGGRYHAKFQLVERRIME